MIKIPLKKACELLDAAWYVSPVEAKSEMISHSSYGCSGDHDASFLDLFAGGDKLMRFIEKDNQEVEIAGAIMRLVNEAGAKMDLVLFIKPNWLEGVRV